MEFVKMGLRFHGFGGNGSDCSPKGGSFQGLWGKEGWDVDADGP